MLSTVPSGYVNYTVRLTEKERQQLQAIADAKKRKPSDLMRWWIARFYAQLENRTNGQPE